MKINQNPKQINKWKIIRLHQPIFKNGKQSKKLIEDKSPGWGLPAIITAPPDEEPIMKWIKSNDISQAFPIERMGFTWIENDVLRVTISDKHRPQYIHGFYHFRAIRLN